MSASAISLSDSIDIGQDSFLTLNQTFFSKVLVIFIEK